MLTTTFARKREESVPLRKGIQRALLGLSCLVLSTTSFAAGGEWRTHGYDDAGTRYSPLAQITPDNAKELGLVWSYDLESSRGVEATPIVVDGVMYVTAPWSVVHALDVRSGKRLWTYDPEVPREKGKNACCDVVNRGVAVHEGKVFVGSLDGRLVAIDARTGKRVWERNTLIDDDKPYTITGAPRVIKGKVVIGNGGAEFGVRGYITAYDPTAASRPGVVPGPGDPSLPFEDASMEAAAKTWDPAGQVLGSGRRRHGVELDGLYRKAGFCCTSAPATPSPWSHRKRSPAGGDNLYTASIVALRPDTGEYVWHYQQTPADNWDYTSTQDLILADIELGGKPRKVILHAPKNGFFFVIDRTDGKFISAQNFVPVNWATGYDENGRPIENPEGAWPGHLSMRFPAPSARTNWHSMSYSPQTGLAYFPAQNIPLVLQEDKNWSYNQAQPGQAMAGIGWNLGMLVNPRPPASQPFGRLIAWDPVQQKEVWRKEHVSPWNGGTLVTAGNVVFQGTADARLLAFDARDGKELWSAPMGTGVIAAPVTYEVDGKQYVSIAVGWGGVYGNFTRASERRTPGTVYTFALGGKAEMPAFTEYQLNNLVSGVDYNPDDVAEGTGLYVTNCVFCHGVPGVDKGGGIPNLGYSTAETIAHLDQFVFKGPFMPRGMPDFTGKLTPEQVEKIKAFILGTADAVRPKK
uniref:1-butanol dehydrogenase (cytochrome c) n=1 Tax=Thauera butanivorans (strain ATCC 43655 / DSM 2080 / JCM 20651 / CCUG 51053 / NBRC 103042 / IAM 12574 / Bu B1211) TaxID=1219356 RepID=BDH_THABB|nr:RecName: Full=1-butanol dehydrogenase (cytochrome c); Short=BDH; AltName: Full=NAD-independent 1-butanol dehydrogenase; AltName: Full=PQQ-containing alcohol dehydrogenase; AltName: Full=Quinohemoprotein; Flags: Precursor [Thauera butanivorans NBRC 103042]AAK27220.2 1-butanol dehydrogenase BDH precursor [Thauera butanivorans]